jgi:hypothetical protein
MEGLMPNAKITAVGLWGAVALIVMGVVDQLAPTTIDFTKEVMGIPLGALIVYVSGLAGGYLKSNPSA